MNEHQQSMETPSETGVKCVFTRYAISTPAARILVVGVAIQIAAVLLSLVASEFVSPDMYAGLEWYQRLLKPARLLALASSVFNLAGWAMVIFACGKVVAESVRESAR